MRSPYLHSVLAHLMKQSRLRIPEEIDGLHRIADKEACAAVTGLPIREDCAQQSEMRARSILKLVDQQMLHALVEPHEHVWAFQCRIGRDASFGKVDDILFREGDAQLRDGVSQDDENAAYRAPLLFAVGAGRKLSQFAERGKQRTIRGKSL